MPRIVPAVAALALAATLGTLVQATASRALAAETDRPNVVFLLLDDMGYADIGAYGNTYHRTPHIDRLAADEGHAVSAG